MTSSEVVVRGGGGLALSAGQSGFTPAQTKALEHIGVKGATPEDLAVFFHVAQRTGLDPFAKQIYMIARKDPQGGVTQTIQVGIDGFRLVARRAADRAGLPLSISGPEWLRSDGVWCEAWDPTWGIPIAARVTVDMGPNRSVGVANFFEYVQRRRDGQPNSFWRNGPAMMIAKCAQALALRTACPHDLSGVHTPEELGEDDPEDIPRRPVAVGAAGVRAALEPPPAPRPAPRPGGRDREATPPPAPSPGTLIVNAFHAKGVTDPQAVRQEVSWIVGRPVADPRDLTPEEVQTILDQLNHADWNTGAPTPGAGDLERAWEESRAAVVQDITPTQESADGGLLPPPPPEPAPTPVRVNDPT